jgi:hypothetical protein
MTTLPASERRPSASSSACWVPDHSVATTPELAELGGVREGARRRAASHLLDEVRQLLRRARAELDLVAQRDEAAGQRLGHLAGTDDADVHGTEPRALTPG